MVVLAWVVSTALSAWSCLYPIRLSAECRDRISHCLGSCGASSPPSAAGTDHWDDQDNRSECERNCHALCDD